MSEDSQRQEFLNSRDIVMPLSPSTSPSNNVVPSADGDFEPLPPIHFIENAAVENTENTEKESKIDPANNLPAEFGTSIEGIELLPPESSDALEAIPPGSVVETETIEQETANSAAVVTGKKVKHRKSFWREVLETVILTVLIFFLVKSLVQNFRIQGTSMESNFHTDQYILVNKVAYFHFDSNAFLRLIPGVHADGVNTVWLFGGPHRGDVIVFQYPKAPQDDYIKRVIGLPGEHVAVHRNIAYINGKALSEPYIKQEEAYAPDYPSANPNDSVVVPPDMLFVMGDNRNGSSDSRSWGFLPIDNIIGKAWFDYWPAFKPGWGFIPDIHPEFAN